MKASFPQVDNIQNEMSTLAAMQAELQKKLQQMEEQVTGFVKPVIVKKESKSVGGVKRPLSNTQSDETSFPAKKKPVYNVPILKKYEGVSIQVCHENQNAEDKKPASAPEIKSIVLKSKALLKSKEESQSFKSKCGKGFKKKKYLDVHKRNGCKTCSNLINIEPKTKSVPLHIKQDTVPPKEIVFDSLDSLLEPKVEIEEEDYEIDLHDHKVDGHISTKYGTNKKEHSGEKHERRNIKVLRKGGRIKPLAQEIKELEAVKVKQVGEQSVRGGGGGVPTLPPGGWSWSRKGGASVCYSSPLHTSYSSCLAALRGMERQQRSAGGGGQDIATMRTNLPLDGWRWLFIVDQGCYIFCAGGSRSCPPGGWC